MTVVDGSPAARASPETVGVRFLPDLEVELRGDDAGAIDAAVRFLDSVTLGLPRGVPPLARVELELRCLADEEAGGAAPRVASLPDVSADGRTAAVEISARGDAVADEVAVVLPAALSVLAAPFGWFVVHAAAVDLDGETVLLPGPEGVGKSTLYHRSRDAGAKGVSEDLVWLHGDGRTSAFPRGGRHGERAAEAAIGRLGLIVLPSIGEDAVHRWTRAETQEVVATLTREVSVPPGVPASAAFRQIVSWAVSVGGYRFAAGRDSPDSGAVLVSEARSALASSAR